MATIAPRVVVVSRRSEFEALLARHATRGQARFFLESRGRPIEPVENDHHRLQRALDSVLASIPARWRRARLDRGDLDRFLFEPEDIVVAVGQDGLAFFVREAFPSVATGVEITAGLLCEGETLRLVSEMNTGGVLFGDGIEDDHLDFAWGQLAQVRVAEKSLGLVVN